jgi:hypothetical protein
MRQERNAFQNVILVSFTTERSRSFAVLASFWKDKRGAWHVQWFPVCQGPEPLASRQISLVAG